MLPLTMAEVTGWDLERALFCGLLLRIIYHPSRGGPARVLDDYLKEEIAAEAKEQNIPGFSEFLRIAALTSSELLNYTNVAVRRHFQRPSAVIFKILEIRF